MIPELNTDKELFEFIKNSGVKEEISLKDIFSQYSTGSIEINSLLKKISEKENLLILDARSESEFNDSHLPFAKNFAVLNNKERHNVGLLYKKYSQKSAVWLAIEYANPKATKLNNFLTENDAGKKEIIVYCWRGGGRSKYLAKMITDAGYKPKFLAGGQKAYRKKAVDFFSGKNKKFNFLELRGMTGSGKTEILNALKKNLPVIDLEFAARHYSSLFGNVPYDINNYPRVKNQSAFENSLFAQFTEYDLENLPLFLIESESKRVGDFSVPDSLYEAVESAPCVEITCSFENRINRIVKDYFGEDKRGITPMKKIFVEKEKFFRAQLSNETYGRLLDYLENEEVSKFTEEMMRLYYDKRYKVKPKKPFAIVSSDSVEEAAEKITSIYKKV
ncbi:MAG: tRNA 2-selenouridine(34) synthase MnmH [Ignavibacteria bacterium]|nr:tRNA 2-selenouridine(34) synthase MnmH [Ignavibacteria bacterium]